MVTQDLEQSFTCCNFVISDVLLCPGLQNQQEAWFAWKFHLLALKMHRQWRWQRSYRTFQAQQQRETKALTQHEAVQTKMQSEQGSQTGTTSQKAFWNMTGHTPHCFLFVSIPTAKGIHQYTLCWPSYKSTGEQTCNTKNQMCWQQPLRLPGNLLAWMDDSIKLQGAKGRKKIGKDGENSG